MLVMLRIQSLTPDPPLVSGKRVVGNCVWFLQLTMTLLAQACTASRFSCPVSSQWQREEQRDGWLLDNVKYQQASQV